MARNVKLLGIVCAAAALLAAGGAKKTIYIEPPAIYIEPQNGFESYISAAFFEKHVPATIANDKPSAAFILRSGAITTQEEKSGLGKLARCAYAFCLGIDGSQTVSVELLESDTNHVVWAYSVRKVGAVSYQRSAEAIAKHLREFLEKKP